MADSDSEDEVDQRKHVVTTDSHDLPALFWDDIPEQTDNPDLAAIKGVLDESTPEERAESDKEQGNKHLQLGQKSKKKFYMHEAITLYTRGIEAKCSNQELNSILYSNRAQAEILLGNWSKGLADSKQAIKLNKDNVKAYYRGARCALKLRKWTEVGYLAEQGLLVDGDAVELVKLKEEARVGEEKEKLQIQKDQEALRRAQEPARQLAQTLLHKGWKVGKPQFSIGQHNKPWLDDVGCVHWPMLFVYPENWQTDAVEDVDELDTLSAHLDVMFGDDAPPLEWDVEGRYTRDKLELYYLSHAATPLDLDQLTEVMYGGWPSEFEDLGPQRYGQHASTWVAVQEESTLGELLSRSDYVVPGIPVVFLVAKGTAFRQRFLNGDIPVVR